MSDAETFGRVYDIKYEGEKTPWYKYPSGFKIRIYCNLCMMGKCSSTMEIKRPGDDETVRKLTFELVDCNQLCTCSCVWKVQFGNKGSVLVYDEEDIVKRSYLLKNEPRENLHGTFSLGGRRFFLKSIYEADSEDDVDDDEDSEEDSDPALDEYEDDTEDDDDEDLEESSEEEEEEEETSDEEEKE